VSRNAVALGAVVGVGALLWLVMAWHAPSGDEEAPVSLEPMDTPVAPLVAPAAPVAPAPEPSPAPALEPAPAQPADPADSEEAKDEPAAPAPPPPPRVLPEQITGDQGPVEEFRSQYAVETRSSDSPQIEANLRNAFYDPRDPDLIKSISCRKSICKLEMQWSMSRMRTYVRGLTRVGNGFERRYGLSPITEPDANGMRTVEVYMKRQTPPPIQPLHAH
jgi:hypothetical protein